MHVLDLARERARRDVVALSFPLIVVHPDHVAVRACEPCVGLEHRLDVVFAGGKRGKTRVGEAERLGIDNRGRAGAPLVHIRTEEGDTGHIRPGFQSWLVSRVLREEHEDAAGDRGLGDGGTERHLYALRAQSRGRDDKHKRDGDTTNTTNRRDHNVSGARCTARSKHGEGARSQGTVRTAAGRPRCRTGALGRPYVGGYSIVILARPRPGHTWC